MTTEQSAQVRERVARTVTDEWLLSDCEGTLQVWRVSALRHVTRDEAGSVTGWTPPSSYRPTDEILTIELDSWDPGEDPGDDQRRTDIADLFEARATEPALLAEAERLRTERDELRAHAEYRLGYIRSLRTRVAELEALVADTTEYLVRRPYRPGVAQVPLAVRLDPLGSGLWCVEDDLSDRGVRRVLTPAGWRMASSLTHAETYRWPDAATAVAAARRALAEGGEQRG